MDLIRTKPLREDGEPQTESSEEEVNDPLELPNQYPREKPQTWAISSLKRKQLPPIKEKAPSPKEEEKEENDAGNKPTQLNSSESEVVDAEAQQAGDGRRESLDSDMVRLASTRCETMSLTPPYYPFAITVFIFGSLILVSGLIVTGVGFSPKNDGTTTAKIIGPLCIVLGLITQIMGMLYFALIGYRHKHLKKSLKGFSTVAKYNSPASPQCEDASEYVMVRSRNHPAELEKVSEMFQASPKQPNGDVKKNGKLRHHQEKTGIQIIEENHKELVDKHREEMKRYRKKNKKKTNRKKRRSRVEAEPEPDPSDSTKPDSKDDIDCVQHQVQHLRQMAPSSYLGGNNLMQQTMRTVDMSLYQ